MKCITIPRVVEGLGLKPKILLCGAEVSNDSTLRGLLARRADLSILRDTPEFANSWRTKQYDLIVLEFSEEWQKDLQLLHSLLMTQPRPAVIVVDGGADRDAVIGSFKVGVKDYFRKPFDRLLLAERVEALLKRKLA